MVFRPTDPMAYRTLEPLYEGQAFSDGYLKDGYDLSTDGAIYPGMVAAQAGEHEFELADGDALAEGGNDGNFYGLFHHFYTASIDDTAEGTLPTAIWKMGGTYKVLGDALDSNEDYEVPTSGIQELIAGATSTGNKGKLIPRPPANTNPTVAILLDAGTNYIEVELLPPSHSF